MPKPFAPWRAVAGRLDSLRRGEEGQTMAEYALVLAVITPVIVASIALMSEGIRSTIENVVSILP